MTKLYPKCLNHEQEPFVTSRGYLLPCCWLDKYKLMTGEIKDLVKPKFKLDTVESIQAIYDSKEWTEFTNNLKQGKGPEVCSLYCSKKDFQTKEFTTVT